MRRALVSLVLVTGLALAGCSHQIAKGTAVAAKQKTHWYLATVTDHEGENLKVRFYDQEEMTLPPQEVKLPLAAKEVKEGADVLAVWKTGQFYPGTVKAVTKTGALIRWHDGSPPSEAEFGKIIAP